MLALITPLLRHGLQFGLGALAARGLIAAEDVTVAMTQWDVVLPVFASVATFGWYVVGFIKKIRAAKVA